MAPAAPPSERVETGSETHRARPGAGGLTGRLWPLLALLAALATLFPFFYESGPLHRPQYNYDHVTFNHLTLAKNLAAEHGWLGYYSGALNDAGEVTYHAYNRFPVLGHFLIKLAILPADGDLAGEIQAGRLLMLALFAAAAMLAYLSIVQLTGRRPLALAATLVAFSSFAALNACDMVATEGTVDLFGTMLAFHGMVRYLCPHGSFLRGAGSCMRGASPSRTPAEGSSRSPAEGSSRSPAEGSFLRGASPSGTPAEGSFLPHVDGGKRGFGQMLAKACIALLLGWHVCALLAPFVVLGLAAAAAGRDWAEVRRLLLFGALASLFGVAVLAANLVREYIALQGETAFWDLPTLRSLWERAAWQELGFRGRAYVQHQLHWLGLSLAPYAVAGIDVAWPGWPLLGFAGGAAIAVMGLAALRPAWRRGRLYSRRTAASLALLPLAATGVCWGIGMHGTLKSFRNVCPVCQLWLPEWGSSVKTDVYEAMFHVGVPLALFVLVAQWVPGLWHRRVALVLPRFGPTFRRTVAAVLLATVWLGFVASAFYMGRLNRDAEIERQERALLADVGAIRQLVAGKKVFAPAPPWQYRPRAHPRNRFYFNHAVLIRRPALARFADFAAGPRFAEAETLTPHNQFYFLYPIEEYRRVCSLFRQAAPDARAYGQDGVVLRRWWCSNRRLAA